MRKKLLHILVQYCRIVWHQHFPIPYSTRNQVDEKPLCGSATSKLINFFLFSFLIYFFIPLNLSNSNGQGCKQFFFLERKKVRWGHHFRLRFYTAHQTKCSTGWKFVHLGVPFTGRNDLNRTKIWMPRRSKIWTPNTRSPHNERFRVNEKSGQVFQSVQNSNGAMWTSVKRTHAP